MKKIGSDLFLIALFAALGIGFISYLDHFFGPYQEKVEISLSFWSLPQYTFFSLARGIFAYCLSFVFTLFFGFWAAKDQIAGKILIPLFDVLQSIPILGFLPGVVLLLTGIFSQSNVGLELAAILLMFTGQVWNMIFGVYHAIRTVPAEKNECATAYRFTPLRRFCQVELPFSATSLIWNSMISVAGGWFFLMINEAFTLGNRDFQLPGIGAYMSVAANQGNVPAMILGILSMLGLILFLNQLVWRPLVAWAQKFRIEETGPMIAGESWFLNILKTSFLLELFGLFFKTFLKWRQDKKSTSRKFNINENVVQVFRSGLLFGVMILVAIALFFVFDLVKEVKLEEWIRLGGLLLLTFGRVYTCVIISVLIMLPLGLLVGLSEKWTQKLQPIIQTAASFPASLLFPIAIIAFQRFHIPLGFGSIILMLMGTQWYVLFNVMGGARAMPSDLREAAQSFRYNRIQRLFWLYLPTTFPYLITGILSASGGAWNASIVAEYVNYQNKVLTTPGIGSMISIAAQDNNYPLLAASIFVMMAAVALINYQVWLRLYRYSEKRLSLNA